MALEFQQDFSLQSGIGSLPKISGIFTALSCLFVVMLLCYFVAVPWIQESQLSIENAGKAQPLFHGAFSRRNVRVHCQFCHRLWSPVQVTESHPLLWEWETDLRNLHAVRSYEHQLGSDGRGSTDSFYTGWEKNTDFCHEIQMLCSSSAGVLWGVC